MEDSSNHSTDHDYSIDDNNSIDYNYSYGYIYEYPYSTAWLAIVPLVVSVVSSVTIVGNVMVIVAYCQSRRIRANVANIFILNLAITDFIVGAFMWPVNLTWLIKDRWAYGEVLCKVWLISDYTVSVMSVLTMVLISWDRYCLLTMGVQYQTFQTKKRLALILCVTWTVVFTWYTFLAFAWSPITGQQQVNYANNCEMEFTFSLGGTIIVNVLEFFIPLTFLLILNTAVFANIKRRSKGVVGPCPSTNNQMALSMSRNQEQTDHSSCPPNDGRLAGSDNQGRVVYGSYDDVNAVAEASEHHRNDHLPINSVTSHSSWSRERTFARHRRAAVVLAILVGCFLICWLPIQVTTVMYAICGDNCVSILSWEITNSLVWCNSLLNPFIYAATNVHFRQSFRHYLLLDRWEFDLKRCKVRVP